jgi:microcystin degradation protein MlrC
MGSTHGGSGREIRREDWRERDVGERVVIRVGEKIDVILSKRTTGKDRDFFKSIGISIPEAKKIIVVKSTQAHRASFDPYVKKTIEVDSPGVSTPGFQRLPYKYIKRPIWPLDKDMSWAL